MCLPRDLLPFSSLIVSPLQGTWTYSHTDLSLSMQPEDALVPVLRKYGPPPSMYLQESIPNTGPTNSTATADDDVDTASVPSLEVASLRLPMLLDLDKIRRRASELVRSRPASTPSGSIVRANNTIHQGRQSEAIELAPIPPTPPHPSVIVAFRPPVYVRPDRFHSNYFETQPLL